MIRVARLDGRRKSRDNEVINKMNYGWTGITR
jgi:hypothetical protein